MRISREIENIEDPGLFNRISDSLFDAVHGDDYQPISDIVKDGGNDGYLHSKKQVYAKNNMIVIPAQRTSKSIKAKLKSDLEKTIKLREDGLDVKRWVAVTNYEITNEVFIYLQKLGKKHGIEVRQMGPTRIANLLSEHPNVMRQYSELYPYASKMDVKQSVKSAGDKPKPTGKDLMTILNLPSQPSAESKTKLLKILRGKSSSETKVQAAHKYLYWYDPTEDASETALEVASIGIREAENINNNASKAAFMSDELKIMAHDLNEKNIAYILSSRVYRQYGIPPDPALDDLYRDIVKDDKRYRSLITKSVNLASGTTVNALGHVLTNIGTAEGGIAASMVKIGKNERAQPHIQLAKNSFLAVLKLKGATGNDKAHAYYNLANQMRFFGDEDKVEAVKYLNKAEKLAQEYGVAILLARIPLLRERIKTGKIPDYASGEREQMPY